MFRVGEKKNHIVLFRINAESEKKTKTRDRHRNHEIRMRSVRQFSFPQKSIELVTENQ